MPATEVVDLYAKELENPASMIESAQCIEVRLKDIPSDVMEILRYMATKKTLDPYEKEPSAVYSFVDAFAKLLEDTDTLAPTLDYSKTFDKLFHNPARHLQYSELAEKVVARMKEEENIEEFPLQMFIKELKSKGILFENERFMIGLTPNALEAKRILDKMRNPDNVYMSLIAASPSKLFEETNKPKCFEEFKDLYLELVMQVINGEKIHVPSKS
jgi:hypothetical protein